jgi:hypothetical protein
MVRVSYQGGDCTGDLADDLINLDITVVTPPANPGDDWQRVTNTLPNETVILDGP